jgi:hypothetical protein
MFSVGSDPRLYNEMTKSELRVGISVELVKGG